MVDDIVARLLRVKYTRERGDGPNGNYWDEPCEADDCGAVAWPVNPDGKEAADEIERLRKDVRHAVLSDSEECKLLTEQNAIIHADLAQARADSAVLECHLGGLLAIIHGDGGHHQDAVGTKQAVEDAHIRWAKLREMAERAEPSGWTTEWLGNDRVRFTYVSPSGYEHLTFEATQAIRDTCSTPASRVGKTQDEVFRVALEGEKKNDPV